MLFVSRPLRTIEKELDDATSHGRHVWAHLEANETCHEVIRDITVVATLGSFLLFQRRFIAQKRIRLHALGREVQYESTTRFLVRSGRCHTGFANDHRYHS